MKPLFAILLCFYWSSLYGDDPQAVPLSDDPFVAVQQLYDRAKAIYKEQPDEAVPLLEQALALAYTTGFDEWITHTQFLLGKTAYKVDDFRLAFEMFSLAKG